jgi:hypothetical protein
MPKDVGRGPKMTACPKGNASLFGLSLFFFFFFSFSYEEVFILGGLQMMCVPALTSLRGFGRMDDRKGRTFRFFEERKDQLFYVCFYVFPAVDTRAPTSSSKLSSGTSWRRGVPPPERSITTILFLFFPFSPLHDAFVTKLRYQGQGHAGCFDPFAFLLAFFSL